MGDRDPSPFGYSLFSYGLDYEYDVRDSTLTDAESQSIANFFSNTDPFVLSSPLRSNPPQKTADRNFVDLLPSHKLGNAKKDLGAILAEECGWQIGREKFLWKNETPASVVVVTDRGFLGRGSVGDVYEVKIKGYEKPMARKRIILAKNRVSALRDRKDIRSEIDNLRRLDHDHVVKILGCYEEQLGRANSICALMFPAGDEDLGHFLYEEYQPASAEHKQWISTWIRCLASALAYMHGQNVHHEDIKPKNIIHQGANIFFTDFSSSRRLDAGQDTSTESPAKASRLFAAPEAMMSEDGKMPRHGSKTDVYSLGLVYVEMIAVLCGKDIIEMHEYLFDEPKQSRQYYRVIDRIPEYLGQECVGAWDHCLKHMLHPTRQSRPSAQGVMAMVEKDMGLRLSKVSCPCSTVRPEGGARKAVHQRAPVTVHCSPTAKPNHGSTNEALASARIGVQKSDKFSITHELGTQQNLNDGPAVRGKPPIGPINHSKGQASTSLTKFTKNNQILLQPSENDWRRLLDNDFVWVEKRQVVCGPIEEEILASGILKRPRADDDDDDDEKRYPASSDIDTVMQYASVGRREAIKVLRENNNDVVNAVMAITIGSDLVELCNRVRLEELVAREELSQSYIALCRTPGMSSHLATEPREIDIRFPLSRYC